MTFREIAEQLEAAAKALDDMAAGRCCCPSGPREVLISNFHGRDCPMRRPTIEHHWAQHFLSDSKSMKLLADARDHVVPA